MGDSRYRALLRQARAAGDMQELFADVVACLSSTQLTAGIEHMTKILRHETLREGNRVWITKDRRKIPIVELDDDHLLNILHSITTYAYKKHSNFMRNLVKQEALRRKLILPENPKEIEA